MEQHLTRPRNKHFRQQVISDLEEKWGNQSPPIIGERKKRFSQFRERSELKT